MVTPAAPSQRNHALTLAVLASQPVRAGIVLHYFSRTRAAVVALDAPLAIGDRVHVRGASSDFLALVSSLRVDGASVARSEGGVVSLALPEHARPGDIVYALRAPA